MVAVAAFFPDEAVMGVVRTAIPSLVLGRSLLVGPVRSPDDDGGVNHKCVFVLVTAGNQSRPIKGGADERSPSIQITVRSDPPSAPRAFRDGQTLARAVYEAVDQSPPAGYCEVRAVSSHPLYIGEDEEGRHEWTINLLMVVDVTT